MARRRGYARRRRLGSHKLPILSLAILGGQAAAAWASTGDALSAIDQFQSYYTGYVFMHKTFAPGNLLVGYAPWLVKRFILPIARPGRSLGKMLPVSLS